MRRKEGTFFIKPSMGKTRHLFADNPLTLLAMLKKDTLAVSW